MQKNICLFLLLSFCNLFVVFGQVSADKNEEKPYIEVTGNAFEDVVPNEIFIQIELKERYVNKVKISVSEQEDKLKSALKWLNIDLANLSLSDADAEYVRIPWRKKDVLTEQDYTLKVSDAATVTKVFQELEKLEIKDARIAKINHSKMDSIQKAVQIKAIKKAKEKADYLLQAINEHTGKPLIVREVGANDLYLRNGRTGENSYYEDGMKVKGKQDIDKDIVQFRKMRVESNIYVKFSIR
ncbi:MAG: SIMPL domain-containing protein [Bacteroidia bacterium]